MNGPRLASQRTMSAVAARLAAGREHDWFVAIGTSMRPTVRAVQRVRLRRVGTRELVTGQVALVRVGGRFWLHRITDEQGSRVHVAGDNGMVNGWTDRGEVFGVLS